MKKIIRWPGAGIFLGITLIFLIFWFFLADALIKHGIEKAGTMSIGARVDLAKADLSLFPLGVDLEGLEITNPDDPMKNMLTMDHISLCLDTGYLFKRKLLIDDMNIEGVRFDTKRKTSGAITTRKKKSQKNKIEKKSFSPIKLPKFEAKDLSSILQKEKLLTTEETEKLKAELANEEKNFKNLLKTLPNEKTFASYQARIKSLQGGGGNSLGGLLGAASKIPALKKDIENDIKRLKDAEKGLKGKMVQYKARIKGLSQLPLKDFNRLKNKYAISSQGAGNMALLIFGPKYSAWISKAVSWYEKIKPFINKPEGKRENVKKSRAKGIDVKFKEYEPIPDFLIRKVRASLIFPFGVLSGVGTDIASDQAIYGKPVSFSFSSEKMNDIDSLKIYGTIDRTHADRPIDTILGRFRGFRMKKTLLTSDSSMPVVLKTAMADLDARVVIQNTNIHSTLKTFLKKVAFRTDSVKGADPLANAMGSALADIKDIRIETELKGTLDKYDIKIHSNVDEVLNKALGKIIKKQAKEFENNLKNEIMKKSSGSIGKLNQQLDGFGSIEKELGKRMNLGNGLIGNINLF